MVQIDNYSTIKIHNTTLIWWSQAEQDTKDRL